MKGKIFKQILYDALRIMNTVYLDKKYHDTWSPENPTVGYSRYISELVYHLASKNNVKLYPYVIETENDKHWFLRTEKGKIIDYDKNAEFQYLYRVGKPTRFPDTRLNSRTKILLNLFNSIMGKEPDEKEQ